MTSVARSYASPTRSRRRRLTCVRRAAGALRSRRPQHVARAVGPGSVRGGHDLPRPARCRAHAVGGEAAVGRGARGHLRGAAAAAHVRGVRRHGRLAARQRRDPAVPAGWEQAIAFAETVARALGVRLERTGDSYAPYHPGRCARLYVGDVTVGHAGELHPSVCKAYGLPPRSAAAELSFDLLCDLVPGPGSVTPVSSWPVAKEDVALIVDTSVQAADVEAALREGAGDLLEDVRLFDVYVSDAIGEGKEVPRVRAARCEPRPNPHRGGGGRCPRRGCRGCAGSKACSAPPLCSASPD